LGVAFYGDRGSGPGIYLAVTLPDSTRRIVRIAGEGQADLGFQDPPASNPITFVFVSTDPDKDARVGVIHRSATAVNQVAEGDAFVVTFLATPSAGNAVLDVPNQDQFVPGILFGAARGLWTVKVRVARDPLTNELQFHVDLPNVVIQEGDRRQC
jgi:hypothetical protein